MTTTAGTVPAGTGGSGGANGGSDGADGGVRQSEPVGGAINRLNAFDGLFLRAEHLTQIQDYARALAYAAGQAAGSGVVYGYDVSVQGDELRVGPGLAISPQGRPLKSDQAATVSLTGLAPQKDGYWIVEIIPDSTVYGDETVFGLLCADPCPGGSTMHPFASEGIRVQLSPRTEEDLDALPYPGHRRGWLASRLFERERRDGGPWLTPTNGGSVPPLSSRPWNTRAPRPVGETVAVAVLLSSDDWEVDAWTARRELGDPSPRRVWQWRLGMRPWDVFVAQILQFQDLLTARYLPPDGLTAAMLLRHVEQQLDYAIEGVKARRQKEPLNALNQLRSAVGGKLAVAPKPLPDLGIGELPPAGYLPMTGQDRVEDQVAALLGPTNVVDARFCRCRPDYVPHAVEEAQHMDRIPLDNPDLPPAIDILVPVPDEGEISPASTAYGWVAFVRRREVDCGPTPTDEVDVYTVDNDQKDVLNSVRSGVVPDELTPLATATYPPGTWAVPPRLAFEQLRSALGDVKTVTLFGLASAEDRRSLAAVRAALLLARFDDHPVSFKLRTAVVTAGRREAIVAVLGALDRGGGIDEGVLNLEHTRPAQPGNT